MPLNIVYFLRILYNKDHNKRIWNDMEEIQNYIFYNFLLNQFPGKTNQ